MVVWSFAMSVCIYYEERFVCMDAFLFVYILLQLIYEGRLAQILLFTYNPKAVDGELCLESSPSENPMCFYHSPHALMMEVINTPFYLVFHFLLPFFYKAFGIVYWTWLSRENSQHFSWSWIPQCLNYKLYVEFIKNDCNMFYYFPIIM